MAKGRVFFLGVWLIALGLHVNAQTKPQILVQPRSSIVGVHQTAQFSVSLNNSGPYSRMIWHNKNPLEGSHQIPPQAAEGVSTTTLTVRDCADNHSYNGTYWIAVTNAAGGTVSKKVRLTVVSPPRITKDPASKTVRAGRTVFFSVAAFSDGAPSKSYQWYKDGRAIPGATFKQLAISNVQSVNRGSYYCVVTTIGGSTTSGSGFLTVLDN